MLRTGLYLIIVISLVTGAFATGKAAGTTADASMPRLSEEFYSCVKEAEWLEARRKLEMLTAAFKEHNWNEADLSVEGIHALADVLIAAKHALTRARPDEHEVQMRALQVRLAVDALEERKQPLWHHYYNVLDDDVKHLREQISAGSKDDLESAVRRLYAHYELIQPALYISRTPEAVKQANALLAFMDKQIRGVAVNREPLREAAAQWDELVYPLFYGTDEEVLAVSTAHESPLVLTSWLLATVIGTVLLYVAWRKARAENTIRRVG